MIKRRHQPTECDACQFPTTHLQVLVDGRNLCELCYGTAASEASTYSSDTQAILTAISFVGNAIIAAIKSTPAVVQNIVVTE